MVFFGGSASIRELEWDTEYFGVTSAKVILHKAILQEEWIVLKKKFDHYEFISIVNKDSETKNAYLICSNTNAVLVDVNIQFSKKVSNLYEKPQEITIYQALEKNTDIMDLAKFHYSRFTEDHRLANRGGRNVYKQWLLNSFGRTDKFYALSRNDLGMVNGFLLYSYIDNKCLIELIAVSQDRENSGIGTSLVKAVEYEAYQNNVLEICVGTQLKNLRAINFYHKIGFKQISNDQIFHLWNID